VTGASIAALAEHCPQMRALYLERAGRIADAAVIALARNCPQLQTLDLGWCDISDDALAALSEHCAELCCLNLGYCDAVTDEGVRTLARGCRKLSSLDIGGCSHLSDTSLEAVAEVRAARAHTALPIVRAVQRLTDRRADRPPRALVPRAVMPPAAVARSRRLQASDHRHRLVRDRKALRGAALDQPALLRARH
jgi:hypothetical protein